MATNPIMTNIDQILESSWDAIEDIADFALFPAGSYLFRGKSVKINPPQPDKNKDANIMLVMEMVTPIDVAEKDQAGVPAAESLLCAYFVGTLGISRLKKTFSNLCQSIGAGSPKDLLDRWEGTEFIAVLKQRPDKNDKEKIYNELVLVVAPQ